MLRDSLTRGRLTAGGCNHPVPGGALRGFVARATSTYFHPVGSCAIGAGTDAVVDASGMPRIVCVNTNAATIMFAERAADLIHESRS